MKGLIPLQRKGLLHCNGLNTPAKRKKAPY